MKGIALLKKFIDDKLFKGDTKFAKEYFLFFWGNMNSGGAGKAAAGLVGTALSGIYQTARNHEKNHVRAQSQLETQECIDNAVQKPKTAEDVLALRTKVEEHVVNRDTVILKTENQINKAYDSFCEWCNNNS
jgi:hypothetical protein